ncbi:MAG: PD-(D/E)XK nuclease family protein [Syntrophobacteraceae bacterium]|nr:PD-(D/E)XK nuclease family protein [Desulfobacteraceae bacterium]
MNNLDLQLQLVDLMKNGCLVLTETDRLKHQIQWRYRLDQAGSGKQGWDTPAVMTLNQWLDRTWEEAWSPERPASPFSVWRTIQECIEKSPPPEPLEPDPSLVLSLEESFESCLRFGVDPGRGMPANRLVEWRREIWNASSERLHRDRQFHRALLPERLTEALQRRPDLIPRKAAIVGFEFAGYKENVLLDLLGSQPEVVRIGLPRGAAEPRALAAADPEQELYTILEDLTAAAARFPLHELGVVLFDSSLYGPMISKHLQDLFGPPVEGDAAAYNLLPDRRLAQQPLFHAAFLPLKVVLDGETRLSLFTLLRSPFYGAFARSSRALSQWDLAWRSRGIEGGLPDLMNSLSPSEKQILPRGGAEVEEGLAPFLEKRSRTCSDWIAALRTFWQRLEFPVVANESDRISWQRLQDLLVEFETAFGATTMQPSRFHNWLRTAGDGVQIQRVGYEDAGIQVLGGLQARGLAFSRLFVPGLVAGTLPQPARPLPFLAPAERRGVLGATPESQYRFGEHLFGNLHAAAPDLVLTRPLMTLSGEPCLPSPFWPEASEERVSPGIPWRHGMPALRRARWVSECLYGLDGRHSSTCGTVACDEASFRVTRLNCPGEISVSDLEGLIACPGAFFFRKLLGLQAIEEPLRGVDPRDRGRMVHAILAAFARRVAREWTRGPVTFEKLKAILIEAAAAELDSSLESPCWSVEMQRLLGGDAEEGGLLVEWLHREWERIEEGWRWIAVESGFQGLEFEGCSISLRGRLDRLDYHPERGLFCWDYKTGAAPSAREVQEDLSQPQLPAYLMAVKKGLLREARAGSQSMAAGYIDLRSVRYLRHQSCIKHGDDLEGLLGQWEERAGMFLNRLRDGRLHPKWLESGCDDSCDYRCLCGLHLQDDAAV